MPTIYCCVILTNHIEETPMTNGLEAHFEPALGVGMAIPGLPVADPAAGPLMRGTVRSLI